MTTVEQGPEDPYYDKWGARMFRADFALGGVWYRVDAYDRAEPQRAREALEELLNGFMLYVAWGAASGAGGRAGNFTGPPGSASLDRTGETGYNTTCITGAEGEE